MSLPEYADNSIFVTALKQSAFLALGLSALQTLRQWLSHSVAVAAMMRLDGPPSQLRFDTALICQPLRRFGVSLSPESIRPAAESRESMAASILMGAVISLVLFRRLLPPFYIGPISITSVGIYLLVPLILLLGAVLQGRGRLQLSRPLSYLLLFTGFAAASLLWTPDLATGLSMLVAIMVSVSFIFSLSLTASTQAGLDRHLAVIIAVTLLTLAVAGIEFATHTHLPVSRLVTAEYDQFGDRLATALWYNSNDFGLFLALAAPIVYGYRSSRHWRVFAMTTVAAICGILLQNGSRAALLAVAVGAVSYVGVRLLAQLAPREWTPPRMVFTTMFLVLPVGIVAATVLVPSLNGSGTSVWVRWQLQRATVSMLRESPLVGVGIGGFETIVASIPVYTAGVYQPHNWLFRLLGEYGVLGAGLFLLGYGLTLDRLFCQSIDSNDAVAAALFASLLSFSVAGLGPSKPLTGLYIFWIVFGLGIAKTARV